MPAPLRTPLSTRPNHSAQRRNRDRVLPSMFLFLFLFGIRAIWEYTDLKELLPPEDTYTGSLEAEADLKAELASEKYTYSGKEFKELKKKIRAKKEKEAREEEAIRNQPLYVNQEAESEDIVGDSKSGSASADSGDVV